MEEKRPIDRKRESGGHADIGSPEDGEILEMTKIGGRLMVIKEKSIYEFMMADDIDPKRTNIGLPNSIHKLIINQGAESEIVSKTFLTAKTLFKREFFDQTYDTDKVLKLSIDIIQKLLILEKEIDEYLQQEKTASEEYEKRRDKNGSYAIPSIVNLETKCETIFQKSDHIEQILMEIIIVFYPNDSLTKQSHFPMLYEVLKKKYGDKDTFSEFIFGSLYFMRVVRALRNGLDHRLNFVSVKNFDLQPDSNIISPTIELNSKEDKLERIALSQFLPIVLKNMVSIIEATLSYLAEKNVKKNILASQVREIPEDQRRYKFVRYCFWSPIGQGGYYNQ